MTKNNKLMTTDLFDLYQVLKAKLKFGGGGGSFRGLSGMVTPSVSKRQQGLFRYHLSNVHDCKFAIEFVETGNLFVQTVSEMKE